MPYDPVQKKRTDRTGGKRDSADISDVTGDIANVSAFGGKKGIGKSGVHLRYHSPDEYKKLSVDKKDELREWRAKTGGGKSNPSHSSDARKKLKLEKEKAIASAVTKQVNEKLKAIEAAKSEAADAEAYVMALIKKKGIKASLADVTAAAAAEPVVTDVDAPPSLRSIIQRARIAKKEKDKKANGN